MTTLPFSTHALAYAAIAILVGWRIYRRVRRLVGRQPVRRGALTVTAVLFTALIVLMGVVGLRNPLLVEGLAAGVVVGIALGFAGLRLTRFEVTDRGYFYVPNTVLGVAVSLLFVGRLIYRLAALYSATGTVDPQAMQSFGSSPLTLAIFGIVAGYYATFSIGILAWHRKARSAGTAGVDAAGTAR